MKIIVDALPESPKDCPFSKRNVEYGYVCTLRPYIHEAHGKPCCTCRRVELCECLIPMQEVLSSAGND